MDYKIYRMEPEQQTEAPWHAARAAAEVLLRPEHALHCASYWVAQCSAYGLPEEAYFGAMIAGLLSETPRLELHCAPCSARRPAFALLQQPVMLRLVGDARHALPLELLAQGQQLRALDSMAALQRPEAQAFASRLDGGLDGELVLRDCRLDWVVQRVVEPSFLVLCAYCVHLPALVHAGCAREAEEWAPRHRQSLQALRDALAVGALGVCGDDTRKQERTRRDLTQLLDALSDTLDFDELMRRLQALWAAKAEWCYARLLELPRGLEI